MWKIWLKNRTIKLKTRIRLYNACNKSIMTYNLAALGATASQTKILDTAHRRHLRRILRVYYPLHISNKNLYKVCTSHEVTKDITKHRWRLFGHILRSNIDTPANIAMIHYFETHSRTTGEKRKRHKGAEATSIAVVLRQDLKLVGQKFHAQTDLTRLRTTAQDRQTWTRLWCSIVRAKEEQETRKHQERHHKRTRRRENEEPAQDDGHRQRRVRLLPPEEPLILRLTQPLVLRISRRPRDAAQEEPQTRQDALRPRYQHEDRPDIHNRRTI
jgi:hypothetical protein